MKLVSILLITLIMTSLNLQASTGETEEFVFDGSNSENATLQLEGEETHTEYRTETRANTCYRQVMVGYQPYCEYRTRIECVYDRMGRQHCRPVQYRECYQRPVYRTEPYTCYETVQIPYEVFDYKVLANVSFRFGQRPEGTRAYEKFTASLNGKDFSLSVKGGGELIVRGKKQESVSQQGNLRVIDISYDVEFADLKKTFAPLSRGINSVKLDPRELSFRAGHMGNWEQATRLNVELMIKRKKLGNDQMLLDRVLSHSEWSAEADLVKVPLSNLVPDLNLDKKHEVKITLKLDFDRQNVLNQSDLPATQISHEFEYEN